MYIFYLAIDRDGRRLTYIPTLHTHTHFYKFKFVRQDPIQGPNQQTAKQEKKRDRTLCQEGWGRGWSTLKNRKQVSLLFSGQKQQQRQVPHTWPYIERGTIYPYPYPYPYPNPNRTLAIRCERMFHSITCHSIKMEQAAEDAKAGGYIWGQQNGNSTTLFS